MFEDEAKQIGTAWTSWRRAPSIPTWSRAASAASPPTIKSHHNVGGLPDYVDFKELVEPLRDLFKDEVRQAGRELGLPEYLVSPPAIPRPRPGHPHHRRCDPREGRYRAGCRRHLARGDRQAGHGSARPASTLPR